MEILVVEGHPLMRLGFEAALRGAADVSPVTTVGGIAEAWASPVLPEADVVLLDITLDGAAGFAADLGGFAAAKLVVHGPASRREELLAALTAGAAAALDSASLSAERCLLAIRAAASGAPFTLPELQGGDGEPALPVAARLTDREQRVLALVAEGLPTRELALEMSYSERTVKKVLGDVVVKLGARSRSQAIARAVRQGII